MLESRPEDALVNTVETVEIVEIVETVVAVETVMAIIVTTVSSSIKESKHHKSPGNNRDINARDDSEQHSPPG